MATITLQQIFDKAWERFVMYDNLPGYAEITKEHGECRYQVEGHPNRMCAVGYALKELNPALFDEIKHRKMYFPDIVREYRNCFDDKLQDTSTSHLLKFQKRLHDDLLDTKGKWLPDYDTKEKRREQYSRTAGEFGLTTPKITLQHIFNKAWERFVEADNPPAIDIGVSGTKRCWYQTPSFPDRMCAIGYALKELDPELFELIKRCPATLADIVVQYRHHFDPEVFESTRMYLNIFQIDLHDGMIEHSAPGGWLTKYMTKEGRKEWYQKVAKKYDLTIPTSEGKV